MTEIYLVRHAEAEGNAYRRIHGQYDSRVTENGLQQIAALEKRFEAIPIDACYASDLNRTCVTSRAIYRPKGLALRRDARFREVNLGRWEDVPFGNLERFEVEKSNQFDHDPLNWSIEGSERFPEYTSRFLTAMREAAEENDGKTIVIFSHGCVLRGVQYLLLDGKWPPYCDNTAVSKLRYENGVFTVEYLNDASHLSDEISTYAREKWWRKGDRRDFNLWYHEENDVYHAMLREQEAGVVQAGSDGTIRMLSLHEAFRGRKLGAQLLGCAVSFCRAHGCKAVSVTLPKDAREVSFYLRHGFYVVEQMDSELRLIKTIALPQE